MLKAPRSKKQRAPRRKTLRKISSDFLARLYRRYRGEREPWLVKRPAPPPEVFDDGEEETSDEGR